MPEKDFHKKFRDYASINLLLAALEKNFPLFRSVNASEDVDGGGKTTREKVFLTLKNFSTSFPHPPVDEKKQ